MGSYQHAAPPHAGSYHFAAPLVHSTSSMSLVGSASTYDIPTTSEYLTSRLDPVYVCSASMRKNE